MTVHHPNDFQALVAYLQFAHPRLHAHLWCDLSKATSQRYHGSEQAKDLRHIQVRRGQVDGLPKFFDQQVCQSHLKHVRSLLTILWPHNYNV
jgi:hypothetical protein